MAKRITKDKIVEDRLFKDLAQDASEFLEVIRSIKAELKTTMKGQSKGLGKMPLGNAKEVNKANDAMKKLNASTAEYERLLKTEKKILAQTTVAQTRKYKSVEKLRAALNDNKKLTRQNIQLENAQAGSIKRLRFETNKLVRERDNLDRTSVQGAKRFRELTKEIARNEQELKRLDAQIGRSQRSVGNYPKALQGMGSSLRMLAGGFTAITVLRSSIDIVKDFDQSMQNLRAISGATGDEFARLEQQARDLGASTQYTASEVAGLQTELAKLGFNTTEITQSTGAILDFATATGAQLPEAATLAGSALRAFNLDATEMERVVSTLGVATTKSALDFNQLNAGLSTVAPVAASFGFSIEDTTALLGQLANAGFDASSSATATRNILLNLADANGKLAKQLGRPVKSADDLAAGLQELQAKGIDLAEALELTDKRSVAAFSTFLSGSDKLVQLRDSITGANEELQEMADIQRDSLQGAFDRLNSAWEGFILDASEAGGALFNLKDIINFVANNLNEIINVLIIATSSWLSFKAALAVEKALKNVGGLLTMLQNIILGASKAFKTGSLSIKGFSAALKSIPFAGIISGITTIISSIALFSDTTDDAAKEQENFNNALESAKTAAAEYNAEIDKTIAKLETQTKQQIELARAQGKSQKEINKLSQEGTSNVIEQIEVEQKAIDERITSLNELKDQYKALQAQKVTPDDIVGAANENERAHRAAKMNEYVEGQLYKLRVESAEILGIQADEFHKIVSQGAFLGTIEGEIVAKGEKYNELLDKRNALQHQTIVDKEKENQLDKKAIEDAKKKAQEYARYLESLRKRLEDLQDQSINDDENREIAIMERKFQRELETIKGNSKLEMDLRIALENELSKQIVQIQDKYRQKRLEEEMATEKEIIDMRLQEQLNANKLNIVSEGQRRIANLEAEREHLGEMIKLKKQHGENTLLLEQQYAIKNEEILDTIAENRLKNQDEAFEQEIKAEEEALKLKEIQALKTIDKEEELTKKQLQNEIEALENEIEIRNYYNKQDLEKEAELLRKKRELNQLYADERLAAQSKFFNNLDIIAQAFYDREKKRSAERIKQIDDEIRAAETRAEEFRKLEAEGNLKADQSLAAELERADKLKRAKEAEEKRQQRREAALAAYNAYSASIQSGKSPKEALADTTFSLTALSAFIRNLPTFFTGTNGKTVGEVLGKPHLNTSKDGYITRVDKDEVILNPMDSAAFINAGGMDAINSFGIDQYKYLPVAPKTTQADRVAAMLSSKLDETNKSLKAIKNRPEYLGTNWDAVYKGIKDLIYQEGKVTEHHHKIKTL